VSKAVRQLPRFGCETRVEIRARDRSEARFVSAKDISQGGLFVETNEPPPVGMMLDVSLDLDDGRTLSLEARVVYAIDSERASRIGSTAGAGLELVGVTASQRRVLDEYLDRVAGNSLPETIDIRPPRRSSAVDLETSAAEARRLVDALVGPDLYRALGVDYAASGEEIETHVRRLIHRFAQAAVGGSSPRRTQLDIACAHLEKVRRLLTDADRRLEYDFRIGLIDVQGRIARAAVNGPSLTRLRDAWHRAFPQKLRESSIHAGAADRFVRAGDRIAALREARAALELDPFNEALRASVDALA
jgi:hypothetical protein